MVETVLFSDGGKTSIGGNMKALWFCSCISCKTCCATCLSIHACFNLTDLDLGEIQTSDNNAEKECGYVVTNCIEFCTFMLINQCSTYSHMTFCVHFICVQI